MWTRAQLTTAFHEAGLRGGDVVLVHSALRKLGPVAGGADAVIDALLDAVAPGGTVAVPTHTWRVVHDTQPVFHQTFTPSNVGALTNVFRQRPGALRSLHPTHSVAALGPRAAEFVTGHERDQTPCSRTSPYGRLRDWGGKILLIGAGLEACTFFHGCEQWSGLTWAVNPTPVQHYCFTSEHRLIPMRLHQHWINTWDQYPRLEAPLVAIGALRLTHLGDCPLRLLDAQAAADWLVAELRRDCRLILTDPPPPGISLTPLTDERLDKEPAHP